MLKASRYMHIHSTCVYIYIYIIYTHIYIYIYRERERERETYIYIYIYRYVGLPFKIVLNHRLSKGLRVGEAYICLKKSCAKSCAYCFSYMRGDRGSMAQVMREVMRRHLCLKKSCAKSCAPSFSIMRAIFSKEPPYRNEQPTAL